MNLENIDEFLYQKSISTIDSYFSYLKKGFDIIDFENNEIPKEKESLIEEYFGKDIIAYQVISTTFVSEVFHIVETYLKSNLLRAGDYLVYPSIDKYPENKLKLENYNKKQKKEITDNILTHTKAVMNNKNERLNELSKKVGNSLFTEEKDILVNTITCSEALFRLEKYLNWEVSDEVKEKFQLFIENRNEIIHFNKLTNLTFACSHSLFVILTLSASNPTLYPKFNLLNDYLNNHINSYNILIVEILYATEIYKAFDKVKENGEAINKILSESKKL